MPTKVVWPGDEVHRWTVEETERAAEMCRLYPSRFVFPMKVTTSEGPGIDRNTKEAEV